jgi:hypothetical protein
MGMRVPKALGLTLSSALMALALMASVAQAATLELGDKPESGEPGFFLSGGTERPTGLTKETIAEKVTGIRILIPGKASEIVCEEGKITEGFIENEYESYTTGTMKKGGHGHKIVIYLGCKVFKINLTTGALEGELSKCTEELNKASGNKLTFIYLILIKVHFPDVYWLLLPLYITKAQEEEAEKLTLPFTTLKFGGTCSLPETVKITGSLAIKAPSVDANKSKVSVNTFSAAGKEEQALLGTKLKFGASEAFVAGEGEIELTGTGKALSWGVM